jgi:hypothetical protein
MDIFEVKEVKSSEKMFKADIKDPSDIMGKYMAAFRRSAQKRWEKKLT